MCALAASLALNVALGWKVQSLTARPATRPGGVQAGTVLPSIPVVGLDGASATLSFRDPRPTILYVLSPHCGWCTRNQANIAALARAHGRRFRFVGLSIARDGLASYAERAQLGFPIFALAAERLIAELDLQATPQTVVVSPAGRVERVWVGAYLQSQPEIERFFGVELPGLIPEEEEGS
jgi:hypothetical protein